MRPPLSIAKSTESGVIAWMWIRRRPRFRRGPTGREQFAQARFQGFVRRSGLHPGLFSVRPSGTKVCRRTQAAEKLNALGEISERLPSGVKTPRFPMALLAPFDCAQGRLQTRSLSKRWLALRFIASCKARAGLATLWAARPGQLSLSRAADDFQPTVSFFLQRCSRGPCR